MNRKIVIAGANGFLGRSLAKAFLASGDLVVSLARKDFPACAGERVVLWNGRDLGIWKDELEGSTALINLAGRSVNCRYTKKNRAEILESRVESTRTLGLAIRACANPPRVWLNSSTATIYRHALDREQTESTGDVGKGFSVEIAKAWEAEFFSHQHEEVRQVAMRTAMVLGREPGGVYDAFCTIARQGLGGRAGRGNQYVSWLHIDDFTGMIEWILAREDLSGAINLSSPDPRPNEEFMRLLRKSIGVSFGLNAPEWMLEIGAFFKKTETELLLKSRRVVPETLLKSGYKMKFEELEVALADLASRKSSAS